VACSESAPPAATATSSSPAVGTLRCWRGGLGPGGDVADTRGSARDASGWARQNPATPRHHAQSCQTAMTAGSCRPTWLAAGHSPDRPWWVVTLYAVCVPRCRYGAWTGSRRSKPSHRRPRRCLRGRGQDHVDVGRSHPPTRAYGRFPRRPWRRGADQAFRSQLAALRAPGKHRRL